MNSELGILNFEGGTLILSTFSIQNSEFRIS